MTIKITYLISCLVLLANCNVYAICTLNCEESVPGSTGYFASGSAHSSQYILPGGEVVTHSKGSTLSSDGLKKTFHQLKQEADQFVSKQKDTVNIPNVLPPLHSSFGQDLLSLQSVGQVGYPAQGNYGVGSQNLQGQTGYSSQGYFNKLESSAGAGSHNPQVYYPTIPHATHVVSTKKEQIQVNKKIVTHGSNSYGASGAGSDVEEIETNQNVLDSNLNGDGLIYKPAPSYISNVNVESGKTQEEIETSRIKGQTGPVVVQTPGQTSFSKYERIQKHNSSSHIIPGLQTYIPNGQFTSGIIGLGDTENVNINKNINQQDLTTFVTNKTPSKLSSAATENHYVQSENTGSFNYEKVGSKIESEVNNQQEEHKYDAVSPVIIGSELPIKIKYVYDGKTVKKIEIYSSGASQNVPITVEEQNNVLKEMRKQSSYGSQSHNIHPVSHEKPESDGYSYPPKDQTFLYPSNEQTFKKEQSQSSHSQQTITDGNVHQFHHLPLNVNSQKQYYTQSGYAGVLPPFSQVKYEGSEQSADAFNRLQNEPLKDPVILIGGIPQLIPVQNQQSSSSSGSTFHSASYSGGIKGGFVSPADSLASSQTSGDVFEKLSSLNSGLSNIGVAASGVPIKNSYGVSTSFSSSSSNINGKKSENRHASVLVDDNGKVDTYNVKS